MKTNHFKNCSAPLCSQTDCSEVVWYAGEDICRCRPLTKLQTRQIRINKLFKKGRFQDKCWLGKELAGSSL